MRCGRCTSVLLLPNKATLCHRPITLHKSRGGENAEQETLDWHWEVATMWEFENMGFSNTLSLGRPAKYLTCADCEQDVLGVHFLDETKLYVAASRVDYST
ncbi:Mss4 protein [Acanthamoeba castellanii str. Neff]|uniref:Mss4 protein n=1 Tax=Acanthamoeba castellanii (strain ATCC 30010 / Neff) TaxID=1257118 RepID=L8H520_ACACF|nr:Mss4 protein [Acanthamoeba castellanii str. Neff]ELR20280.1 Mss4 protein [Acanthamoeba castellanii str. Neff]